jgi:hypothetical protein
MKRYNMKFQTQRMFRQVNCHSQGVFIKVVQELPAANCAICGFTEEV